MKNVIVLMLLVAALAGCTVRMAPDEMEKAQKEKAFADAQERIRELKVVKMEQELMKQILQLRYESAVLNSKMKASLPKQQPVQQPVQKKPKE